MMCTVYNIDHIYELQIENTNESNLHSSEATKAVAKKPRKTSEAKGEHWKIDD